MNKEFFEAVALMEKEKGIQADYLYEKISEAIVKAVRKDYNNKDVVACDIDPEARTMRVYVHLNIVEELEDWDTDILVEDAQEYRADAKAGETLEIDVAPNSLFTVSEAGNAIRKSFNKKDFKTFLSKFDGINVNIKEKIDFKSQEYNLYLEPGEQSVSGDIAFKLLAICDDKTVEPLLCDVINSILIPKYIDKSDSLFKTFANSCITDISIIDYTDKIEKLRIYANAKDKFRPTPYMVGE